MSTRDQVLEEIESFMARHGMSAGDFGIKCMRNPSFVYRLREGHDIRASSIDKVRAFIAARDRPLARRRKVDEAVA